MGIADELIREHEQMASARGVWDSHWQETADRILPRQAEFTTKRTDGEKRTEKLFDSTAARALERFAAILDSMLTPRTQKWNRLRATNRELNKNTNVKKYFEASTEALFDERYSPRANFASQNNERWMSLGAFGNGLLYSEGHQFGGLRYKSCHLAETYFAENYQGVVDKLNRKFEWTARQAAQKWGMDKLPAKIKAAFEKNSEQKFEWLHVVRPNEERIRGSRGVRGKAFSSYYVCLSERHLMDWGGYRTFPYSVSRYVTSPREVYGRGPAMMVLPDIKMLNEMSKTTIRAAHRIAAPPLLIHDDGIGAFRMSVRPDAMNYGMVTENGQPRVHPLATGGNLPISLEMENQRREAINDAFLITLFQVLMENPTMTATEVLERAREKGILLAPTIGRQQSEALGPMIEREIDILAEQGRLPPMPEELIEAEGEYRIEYESPLNRIMKAEDAIAILRTIEAMAPLAQINPKVMRRINGDKALEFLWETNGAPLSVLYTEDELKQMDDAESQAASAAALLEAAPVAAGAAKTAAEAQVIAQAGTAGRI